MGVGSWTLGVSDGDRFFAVGGTLLIAGSHPAIGVYGDKIVSNVDLNEDDVVWVEPNSGFADAPLARIEDIRLALADDFREPRSEWATDGMPCKVLLTTKGGGWQKGKIRIKFEFIPDEPIKPPSPLDDLRS